MDKTSWISSLIPDSVLLITTHESYCLWATEHFIKSSNFDLLLEFVVRTPPSASYRVILLGTLTHLARTRPRFILLNRHMIH